MDWLHHQFLLNQITIENINSKVLVRSLSGIKTEQRKIFEVNPDLLVQKCITVAKYFEYCTENRGSTSF